MTEPQFKVGDRVYKATGDYHWRGVVSSVFYTPNADLRYVVAHKVDEGYVLHIYSEKNLRLLIHHDVYEGATVDNDSEEDGTEEERGAER